MAKRAHLKLELAVDLVLLTVRESRLQVLVIGRRNEPFVGRNALPGGFIREDEDLLEAAVRELEEETALEGAALHLEQLAVYGAPDRDPRGRVVSVAFLGFMPDLPIPTAGSDAARADWAPVDVVRGSLAFDHDLILADGVEQARSRLEFTTMATDFCEPLFTMGELQGVYEAVWGTDLDIRNFSRKVKSSKGFVVETEERRSSSGRPATLFRRGAQTRLMPPLLRP